MSADYEDDDSDDEGVCAAIAPSSVPDMDVPDVSVSFTVSAASMQKHIVSMVGAIVSEHFKQTVRETVEVAVRDLVTTIAQEQIADDVRTVLADGWARTNEYGESRGKASLRDRIGEMLRAADRYGNRASWLDALVKEEMKKAIQGDIAKDIEAARAKLRAEVDQVTRAKLNEALRAALGVA